MKIRKAREEDAKRMSYLRRKTFKKINSKDYSNEIVREYNKKQTPARMRKDVRECSCFLLEDKDKLIGMIKFCNNRIGGLFVRHDRIGRGYGKKLLDFTENYLEKKGTKKIILYPSVMSENFYLKNGYKKTKEFSIWKIGEEKLKVFKWEKKL